jgi:CBS domain-containing protein
VSRLSEILDEKGHDVARISGDASVRDAVKTMVDANIGALLVTEDDEIVGIFTERDYLRRMAVSDRRDEETPVRDVMTSPVMIVGPDTSVDETMALMTDRRIRHAPVVDDGELVGMISIGDLVKYQSKRQSFEIKYLTDYITGR